MKGVISVVQKSQAHFVLLVLRCSGDCHLLQKIINTDKAVKGTKKNGNDIGWGGGSQCAFFSWKVFCEPNYDSSEWRISYRDAQFFLARET